MPAGPLGGGNVDVDVYDAVRDEGMVKTLKAWKSRAACGGLHKGDAVVPFRNHSTPGAGPGGHGRVAGGMLDELRLSWAGKMPSWMDALWRDVAWLGCFWSAGRPICRPVSSFSPSLAFCYHQPRSSPSSSPYGPAAPQRAGTTPSPDRLPPSPSTILPSGKDKSTDAAILQRRVGGWISTWNPEAGQSISDAAAFLLSALLRAKERRTNHRVNNPNSSCTP
ncbi:hypothetical protein DFH06DRAFT_1320108 [Mycena polygramma]|nr:hypothetical protein DFH06DRAFT_1320108 [Mycena polygramma]